MMNVQEIYHDDEKRRIYIKNNKNKKNKKEEGDWRHKRRHKVPKFFTISFFQINYELQREVYTHYTHAPIDVYDLYL